MENSVDDKIQLLKEGDQVYRVTKFKNSNEFHVDEVKIVLSEFVNYERDYWSGKSLGHWYYRDNRGHSYFNRNFNKTIFKTKEDAEKEIVKRHHISLKRRLLKNYEKKLNEAFDIGDHYIIK